MATTTPPPSDPAENAARLFWADLNNADLIRVGALAGLASLRAARFALMEREAAQLRRERKQGDPELLHLEARLANENRFAEALRTELKISEAKPPVNLKNAKGRTASTATNPAKPVRRNPNR